MKEVDCDTITIKKNYHGNKKNEYIFDTFEFAKMNSRNEKVVWKLTLGRYFSKYDRDHRAPNLSSCALEIITVKN